MFKVINGGFAPKRSTKYSAYVDLFAREDIVIGAGETKIVKLGVKLDLEKLKEDNISMFSEPIFGANFGFIDSEFNEDYFNQFLKSHYLEVALRSSLGVKGLIIANGIGIIDLDYPDEIGLIVHNPMKQDTLCAYQDGTIGVDVHNDSFFVIKKGDKVAQCALKEHKGYLMGYESDNVRVGGFGSTDKEVHISNMLDDLPDYFKCNELN